MPYCRPDKIKERVENLGDILAGDVVENAPYELKMNINETCKALCKMDHGDLQKELFRRRIDRDYAVNWIVDNLPAATKYVRQEGGVGEYIYMNGFPVGMIENGKYFVHNHVRITLNYHENPSSYVGYRIVGFEVEPRSLTQSVRSLGEGEFSAICSGSNTET